MLTDTVTYWEAIRTFVASVGIVYGLIAMVDSVKDLFLDDLGLVLRRLAWVTLYLNFVVCTGLTIFGLAGWYAMGQPPPVEADDKFVVDVLSLMTIFFEFLLVGAAYLQVWVRRWVKQWFHSWDQVTERRGHKERHDAL